MSKSLVLNVTKDELQFRVASVIEEVMGSPIVKRREKILNRSLVTLLHGIHHHQGQNENTLDQYWKELSEPTYSPSGTIWIANETYHIDDGIYHSESSQYTGVSEADVKRKLYSAILKDYALIALHSHRNFKVNKFKLFDRLKSDGFDFGTDFLIKNKKSVNELNEEDLIDFIKSSEYADISIQEVIFYFVVSSAALGGSHEIFEVKQPATKDNTIAPQEHGFMDKVREAITNEDDEQWIYSRTEKRCIEINLGSGVNLEVTYYDMEDISPDNIESALLIEDKKQTYLDEEEIDMLVKLDIL